MLNGDFSAYSGTLGAPFTTVNGKKNQIDPSLYDQAAVTTARTVFPQGADPATGLVYYTTPKTIEIFHEGTGRLDYTINDQQRLVLRSFIQYYDRPANLAPGDALASVQGKDAKLFNEVLNHTWMLSPTTVNALSLFWNQINVSTGAQVLDSNGQPFCLSRITNVEDPTGACYLGTFGVTGGFSASNSGYAEERRNSFGVSDSITKTIGNHTLTAGGDIWHQWARELTYYPSNPIITFSGYYTGLGLADFLPWQGRDLSTGCRRACGSAGQPVRSLCAGPVPAPSQRYRYRWSPVGSQPDARCKGRTGLRLFARSAEHNVSWRTAWPCLSWRCRCS